MLLLFSVIWPQISYKIKLLSTVKPLPLDPLKPSARSFPPQFLFTDVLTLICIQHAGDLLRLNAQRP